MKIIFRFTTLLLLVLSVSHLYAQQDDREDVVYLRNGNIYRGTITLQVPGDYLKIETGKDVLTVDFKDVEKITKEKKLNPNVQTGERYDDTDRDRYDRHDRYDRYEDRERVRDRRRRPKEFVYRKKGYFFQGQVMVGALEVGLRIINGYKFGQFGFLGVGVGVDGVILDVKTGSTDYAGPHFPVFLHYEGDILKKRITPFYQLEAGYSFRPSSGGLPFADNGIRTHGGPMGGVGFGARFYKSNRVNFNLSLNVDIKYPTNKYTQYNYNGVPYTYTSSQVMIFPAFKFGIGF